MNSNNTLKSMESHIGNPEIVLGKFNDIEKYPLSGAILQDIKETLLYSLETFSYNVNNTNEYIQNLLDITEDEERFSKFTDKEKGRFYSVIGYNYFALGNVNDTLIYYKKALEKGFSNIFEAYVNVFVLKDILENPSNINILITSIEKDLEQVLDKYPNIFSNQIRADIENLILGGLEGIKNISNFSDNIYNYELEYEKINQDFGTGKIVKEEATNLLETLVSKIKEDDFEDNERQILLDLKNNMSGLGKVDYNFFSKVNYNLIETGFNLIEIYLGNGNKYKALKILKFMFDYGFENTTFNNRGIIIKKLNLLLDDFPIDYNDISTYFKNLTLPIDYIVDYANIYLKLGNLYQAFNLFITIGELYPQETILGLKSILLNIIDTQELSQDEILRLSQFIEMLDSADIIPTDKSFYDFIGKFL